MKNLAPILLLTASVMWHACTTTSSEKSSNDNEFDAMGLEANNPRDVIVHQSQRRKPLISRFDRKHWVDLRKVTKPGQKRLYTTLATGEWEVAEKDARSYLMSNPKDPVGLSVLSLAVSMQKKFRLGAYYASLYERYHGESPTSLNIRALALVTVNDGNPRDYDEATQLLKKAFHNNPEEIASGLNLGHLYLERGDANKAAEVFGDVKARCKGCIPGLVGEGIAYSRLRNYKAARANFEGVLKIQEHHPQALYRLAQIEYHDTKDLEKAKSYIDELMVRTPQSQFLIRQKAQALVLALDAESDPTAIAESKGVPAPAIDDDSEITEKDLLEPAGL